MCCRDAKIMNAGPWRRQRRPGVRRKRGQRKSRKRSLATPPATPPATPHLRTSRYLGQKQGGDGFSLRSELSDLCFCFSPASMLGPRVLLWLIRVAVDRHVHKASKGRTRCVRPNKAVQDMQIPFEKTSGCMKKRPSANSEDVRRRRILCANPFSITAHICKSLCGASSAASLFALCLCGSCL